MDLCAGSVFTLTNPITFTAPGQTIETQGLPTDSTRALLKTTGSSQATAISGGNQSNVTVQNIQVDGQRPQLGLVTNGAALLEMGGADTGQVVRNSVLSNPRGWSALHLIEGGVTNGIPACQNGKILNNTIGPVGTPDGHWADGISLACGNSDVEGNTITDATDGAIVIFGAAGSQIKNNTVIAQNQVLLGGINMVDYNPTSGDYNGTVVSGNTINAAGSLIKVAVAMGPLTWGCGSTNVNYGAAVTNNTLEGAHMGYGFVANGVQNWTVTGNVDNSTHVGYVSATNCSGTPAAQPSGFQSGNVTGNSSLQSNFVSSPNLTSLLGLTEQPTTISLQANTGMVVTAENAGSAPLWANRTAVGPWEKFDVTYLSGDQVQLKAEANGLWVTADNWGNSPLIANRTTPQLWETFHLIHNSNGTVSLLAEVNNQYVTSNNGTAALIANRPASNSWEQFTLYSD
ncbi:right-handed parallel beta-helix repeat-containing protein [Streptomyces hygroscopicus]|uniref:right-handed parallel beta-helix repeat-containing protein n=1 Tax=Streptomyces hygroscopicus TaxID=1912 RepID=UPI00223E9486|nr:right-handed parallel beta-helix repeat-containing protein [Streptomyces hygroscopicus]